MTQGENHQIDHPPSEIDTQAKESKLASALERLAFRLHDFANRLMGYLR